MNVMEANTISKRLKQPKKLGKGVYQLDFWKFHENEFSHLPVESKKNKTTSDTDGQTNLEIQVNSDSLVYST